MHMPRRSTQTHGKVAICVTERPGGTVQTDSGGQTSPRPRTRAPTTGPTSASPPTDWRIPQSRVSSGVTYKMDHSVIWKIPPGPGRETTSYLVSP